jgi:hypothetical protein
VARTCRWKARTGTGGCRSTPVYGAIFQSTTSIIGEDGDAYLARARALHAMGRHDEARAAAPVAVERLERSVGPNHPETQSARQLATPYFRKSLAPLKFFLKVCRLFLPHPVFYSRAFPDGDASNLWQDKRAASPNFRPRRYYSRPKEMATSRQLFMGDYMKNQSTKSLAIVLVLVLGMTYVQSALAQRFNQVSVKGKIPLIQVAPGGTSVWALASSGHPYVYKNKQFIPANQIFLCQIGLPG